MTDTPDDPVLSPRARAWILAALAIVLGSSFPYLSRMMNANERPRVLQAIAWVDSGELAIDGPAARGIPAGVDVSRSPVDGRLYPNKPPGATVPAVVGYGALRLVAAARGDAPTLREATWVTRIAGGLLPALVLAGFLIRRQPRAAPAVVVMFIATPVVAYSRLLFGHMLAAALLTIGLMLVVDALAKPDASRRAFAGGLLAAGAVTVEYGAAFGGLPLAVMVFSALRRPEARSTAVSAMVGAALPIAVLALYHDAVFGAPWSTPYHHVVDKGFAATHGRGLLGLSVPTGTSLYEHLLSPWGGALYWAPIPLAVFCLSAIRWRTLSPLSRLLTATFGVMLLFNLGLSQTGGWRVGPRYLVVAMPLLAVPLAEQWRTLVRSRLGGALVVGLVLWSVQVNFLAGNLFPHLVPSGNPLLDLLLPLGIGGYAPYSLLSPALGAVGGLVAVGIITLVLAAWAVLSLSWDDSRSVIIAMVGGFVLSMAAFVGALGVASAPDAKTNLKAVQGIWEPRADAMVAHTVLEPLDLESP